MGRRIQRALTTGGIAPGRTGVPGAAGVWETRSEGSFGNFGWAASRVNTPAAAAEQPATQRFVLDTRRKPSSRHWPGLLGVTPVSRAALRPT